MAQLMAILVVLACLAAPAIAQTTAAAKVPKVVESTLGFESNGHKIQVNCFAPDDKEKHPAVIVLHGSGGGNPFTLRNVGEQLVGEGYVAYVVYYMDSTGHKAALERKTIDENFMTWLAAVQDSLAFVRKQDGVDAGKIGLLGFSLGGYLAVSAGEADPGKIAVVVEYFGGIPDPLAEKMNKMPPTLILHGEDDAVVQVAEAHKLEKLLQEHKQSFEIHTYPKTGHNFSMMGSAAATDAAARTSAYLAKYLKVAGK